MCELGSEVRLSSFNFNPQDFNADPVEAAYRNAFGDGLERALGDGAESLNQVADDLNAQGVPGPNGVRWTEEILASELRRLAW